MATLKITFTNMFLLVRGATPVVLLPNGEPSHSHTVTIKGVRGAGRPLTPTGSDFTICVHAGGVHTPWAGLSSSVNWPDEMLLNLCTLPGTVDGCRVKKTFHSQDPTGGSPTCPTELHARFYLPCGRFETQSGDKKWPYLAQPWKIPQKGNAHHVQFLRDSVKFECALDPKARYSIEERTAAGATPYDLQTKAGQDIEINVSSTDGGRYVSSKFANDFEVLYALAVDPKSWPVPEKTGSLFANLPFLSPAEIELFGAGPDRPICGAGQGCPEP